MARMPHNIEKSVFRRGTHVGYGGGFVWRISRTTSALGRYVAVAQENGTSVPGKPALYANRLTDMGDKLHAESVAAARATA